MVTDRDRPARRLDAGRGQPNWVPTEPRAALFTLGSFAAGEADAASSSAWWGESPGADGIAERLRQFVAGADHPGGRLLLDTIGYAVDELGFDPDQWVHELVVAVLGAGYPSPNLVLTHIERVLEHYLVVMAGISPRPPGRFRFVVTEGGAAAMSYVFRTLQENDLVEHGDAIAIATPVFTPYLQIPTLEDFGFRVVEIKAAHDTDHRFDAGAFEPLADPSIKAFIVVNPGNPDSRAMVPERLRELRDFVLERRPDLIVVADTAYANFVEDFRGLIAELPHNVVCLHSFSKNYGATGNRLGFVAVHEDNVADRRLASADESTIARLGVRYRSRTADVRSLTFLERLSADSREVALHNIAGLATPDQVQMALFALTSLVPWGVEYCAATRAELATRLDALLGPLGIPPAGGHDSMYYALVDLLAVVRVRHGEAAARAMADRVRPETVAHRLADEHGVIVLPGAFFDAASWDVRISLASLPADDLREVGTAIASTLDALDSGE